MNPQNININNGGDEINNSGGGGGGPCGACKFLRRKCLPSCVFAPYFDSDQGATHFAAVHRVFGASNISKLLSQVSIDKRIDCVLTTCYEAQARLRDPVYGSVGLIIQLQQQIMNLQAEYGNVHARFAANNIPKPPPFLQQQVTMPPPPLTLSDLPPITSAQAGYDLSFMLDPPVNQASWAMPPHMDPSRFIGTTPPRTSAAERVPTDPAIEDFINGDLQDLAREFLGKYAIAPSGGTGYGGYDNK